jgi:hypothetical protein
MDSSADPNYWFGDWSDLPSSLWSDVSVSSSPSSDAAMSISWSNVSIVHTRPNILRFAVRGGSGAGVPGLTLSLIPNVLPYAGGSYIASLRFTDWSLFDTRFAIYHDSESGSATASALVVGSALNVSLSLGAGRHLVFASTPCTLTRFHPRSPSSRSSFERRFLSLRLPSRPRYLQLSGWSGALCRTLRLGQLAFE